MTSLRKPVEPVSVLMRTCSSSSSNEWEGRQDLRSFPAPPPHSSARPVEADTRHGDVLERDCAAQAADARPVARPEGALAHAHVGGMDSHVVVARRDERAVHPEVVAVDVDAVLRWGVEEGGG